MMEEGNRAEVSNNYSGVYLPRNSPQMTWREVMNNAASSK